MSDLLRAEDLLADPGGKRTSMVTRGGGVVVVGTLAILLAAAVELPPSTQTEEASRTLFGMKFGDPYEWIEKGGGRFDAWASTQSIHTRAIF